MPVSVVDASAVAAVVFNEAPGRAIQQRLQGHQLIAPMLLTYELTSVCLKKCRERPEKRDAILMGLRNGLSLPLELLRVDHASTVGLAEKQGISAYDASYLWLSMTTSAALVTLDRKLLKVAQRLGVS